MIRDGPDEMAVQRGGQDGSATPIARWSRPKRSVLTREAIRQSSRRARVQDFEARECRPAESTKGERTASAQCLRVRFDDLAKTRSTHVLEVPERVLHDHVHVALRTRKRRISLERGKTKAKPRRCRSKTIKPIASCPRGNVGVGGRVDPTNATNCSYWRCTRPRIGDAVRPFGLLSGRLQSSRGSSHMAVTTSRVVLLKAHEVSRVPSRHAIELMLEGGTIGGSEVTSSSG